jgi:hypothetical protein
MVPGRSFVPAIRFRAEKPVFHQGQGKHAHPRQFKKISPLHDQSPE